MVTTAVVISKLEQHIRDYFLNVYQFLGLIWYVLIVIEMPHFE